MKVPLTKGLFAEIDKSDYGLVSKYKWCASKCGNKFYAMTYVGGGRSDSKFVRMHALIMGTSPGQRVDHKDGNGLNNRRCNLRKATHGQNLAYCFGRALGESGFKGVRLEKVGFSGRVGSKWLGKFDSAEEAAFAVDATLIEKYGEFAVTNKMLGLL